jgi:hypothetical protein
MIPGPKVDRWGRAGGFSGRGLIDHDHLSDMLDARQFLNRAGILLDWFAAFAEEVAVE